MEKAQAQVALASSYRPNVLASSNGQKECVLLKQYNFPFQYSTEEKLLTIYSDEAEKIDSELFINQFGKFKLVLVKNIEFWLLREKEKKILNFLKRIMRADKNVNWSGWRVMINLESSSYTNFVLELFARDISGTTVVYSDVFTAPNIKE